MSRAEQAMRDENAMDEPAERFFVMPMAGGAKGGQKMAPAPAPGGGKGKGKGKEASEDAGNDPDEGFADQGNVVFLSLLMGWSGLGHDAHLLVEGVKTAIEISDSMNEDKKVNPDPKAAMDPKYSFNFGKPKADPAFALYGATSGKQNDEAVLTRLAKRRMDDAKMRRSPGAPRF